MSHRIVSSPSQQTALNRVQKCVTARLNIVMTMIAGLAMSVGAHASQSDGRTEREALLERVVLDDKLEPTTLRVMSMNELELVGRTNEGKLLRLPVDKILAILPASFELQSGKARLFSPRDPRSNDQSFFDGLLLLTDGQSLAGGPVKDVSTLDAFHEALPWQSPILDRIVIPLEHISVALMRGKNVIWPTDMSSDVVILKNSDIAQGYINTRFEPGDSEVSIFVEGENGKTRRIQQKRVSSIFLSNPVSHEGGGWVWLSDGSALRTTGVQFGLDMQGGVTSVFTTAMLLGKQVDDSREPAKPLQFEPGTVLAYTPHRDALSSLAKAPWSTQSTDKSRRWTTPPIVGDPILAPLGAADIELPGPMSVTWTLPLLATRIAGVLELPESSRVWGDCNVTILASDGGKLFTTRLNADKPQVPFNVALPTGKQSLTVRVDAGENGPIEDRVLIRRALILLDVKDPASAPSTKPAPAPRG